MLILQKEKFRCGIDAMRAPKVAGPWATTGVRVPVGCGAIARVPVDLLDQERLRAGEPTAKCEPETTFSICYPNQHIRHYQPSQSVARRPNISAVTLGQVGRQRSQKVLGSNWTRGKAVDVMGGPRRPQLRVGSTWHCRVRVRSFVCKDLEKILAVCLVGGHVVRSGMPLTAGPAAYSP